MPIYVALGANLPHGNALPLDMVELALRALGDKGMVSADVSRSYATPAVPAGSGPDFVNAVARLESDMAPAEVLAHLHDVEAHFGRKRARRWGARTLDLDLLAVGGQVLPDAGTQARWRDLPRAAQRRESPDTLILPHPRLAERGFVLVPWAEIAPDWRHPLTGRSVAEMRAALTPEDLAGIRPIGAGA